LYAGVANAGKVGAPVFHLRFDIASESGIAQIPLEVTYCKRAQKYASGAKAGFPNLSFGYCQGPSSGIIGMRPEVRSIASGEKNASQGNGKSNCAYLSYATKFRKER
tara:strand:- start:99 stop:419 length:321 start_codon:yes stop_codon:yes gene_type:complete